MYNTNQASSDYHSNALRYRGKNNEDTGDGYVKSMLFPSNQTHAGNSPVVTFSSRQQLGSSPVLAMKSPSPSRLRYDPQSGHIQPTSSNNKNTAFGFSLPSTSLMDETSPGVAPFIGVPSNSLYSEATTPSRMSITEQLPTGLSFASRGDFSPAPMTATSSSQLPLAAYSTSASGLSTNSFRSDGSIAQQETILQNWAVVFGFAPGKHFSQDVIRSFQEFGSVEEYVIGAGNWLCLRFASQGQLDRAVAACASGFQMTTNDQILLGAVRLTHPLAVKLGLDVKGNAVSAAAITAALRQPQTRETSRLTADSEGDNLMIVPDRNKNICARLLEWFFVF